MKLNYVASALLGLSVITTGCGGGGGGGTAAPTTLSGTAAAGAPLIGTVTVKGALGNTKSAFIEADGSYDVDVTGLTAPYRLRAQGTVGGRTYKLHSYAVESDVGNTVNITPFTDLIVANAAQQIAETYFESSTPTELTEAEIDAQETALETKLQAVFTAVGMTGAIDLLNATFSADHSGLDAALDLVTVEVDPIANAATITDFLGNSISDNLIDDTQDDAALTVADQTAYTAAATTSVSDTQAIADLFTTMASAFASGLPTQAAIQDLFADDFLHDDYNKGLFLTDITTDPALIGMMFSGVSVSNLDSTAGTAEITFTFGANGVLEYKPETWYVSKDATLGWQLRGNQQIVETYFSYHCNDNDGNGGFAGACGINTQYWDEDFTNNGTGGAEIQSGTVEIINGTDGSTVKATVYLGTPAGGTAGDVQVYNEADGQYYGDWKAFGTVGSPELGTIDPAIFAEGDIIKYSLYTGALDISTQASPAVDLATFVTSYTDTVLFTPEVTTAKIPSLTQTAIDAMDAFALGDDLVLSWTLVSGTRNEEVLVEISDASGNRAEIWDWMLGDTATSKTFSSSVLDAAVTAATADGFDTNATPLTLKVRIYAADELTGESHSRDYDVEIGSGGSGGSCDVTGVTTLNDFTSIMTACSTFVAFNANDLTGNAFEFSTAPGEIMSFTDASNGEFSNDGGSTWTPFTWSIDGNGFLQINYTSFGMSDWIAIYGGTPSALLIKAFTDEDNSVFEETVVPWSAGGLTCGYETTWDDTADGGLGAPVTGKSFADFEALLADCGTAVSFTAADVAGTAYNDGGGEITTFNALGGAAGTQADPGTGTHDDGAGTVIAMEWYVEAATCTGCTHSYVVTYTDDTIETTNIPAGFWFRGTAALYGVTGTPGQAGSVYSFYHYDEQSNYSDADRAAGTDGDIWLNGDTLQ